MEKEGEVLSLEEKARWQELKDLVSSGDPLHKYKKFEKIGAGGIAKVYRGETIIGKDKVAIKVVEMTTLPDTQLIATELINEVAAMKHFPHPNMPEYLDSYIVGKQLWIVMEYLNAVRLDQLIKNMFLKPHQIAAICFQILGVLKHLHANKLIHRDIKSPNIMLDVHGGQVKVIDLGLVTSDTGEQTGKFGTPHWLAPEMIRGDKYNSGVDMWSFGITVYEMVTGDVPHAKEAQGTVLELILENGTPEIPLEHLVDRGVRTILKSCLQVDPTVRVSAESLLRHPFLQNAEFTSECDVKDLVREYFRRTH